MYIFGLLIFLMHTEKSFLIPCPALWDWKAFSVCLPIYFLQFLFGPLYPLFIYTLPYLSFSDFYFIFFPSRNEFLFLFFQTIYLFPIPTWIFYRPNTINRYTGRKSYYLFLSCLPLNLRDVKESGMVGRTTYQDQRKHFLFCNQNN